MNPRLLAIRIFLPLFFLPGAASGMLLVPPLLDQIGDPGSYNFGGAASPNVSQIFTDFSSFDSMSLDDFSVSPGETTIRSVQGLFLAQSGFESFASLTGYRVSFFASPGDAGISLLGDEALVSTFIDASSASLTQIGGGGHGLVTLTGEWEMPSAGSYWVGVAPVGSFTVAGQFFLMNRAGGGGENGVFVNPGEGFGSGVSTPAGVDYAYVISTEVVPEPSIASLLVMGLACSTLLRRRRRLEKS